ncbi:Phospholipid-transporting ATPase 2 [Acorus gramineus]|uniref:Phospholipid-transporting ATPase 2 n=1 Tax=Acorus gramineus TaxID=55184 RepID=A0AAV9A751_ACOGR|nr:Phospholipid-transporting ATPase 2 [Acorus gramineus]
MQAARAADYSIGKFRFLKRLILVHGRYSYNRTAFLSQLLNPSTFAGWFGRSLFHAAVVFIISIHAYADEKSEMEELSMVALSGCIWLQAFVVILETKYASD